VGLWRLGKKHALDLVAEEEKGENRFSYRTIDVQVETGGVRPHMSTGRNNARRNRLIKIRPREKNNLQFCGRSNAAGNSDRIGSDRTDRNGSLEPERDLAFSKNQTTGGVEARSEIEEEEQRISRRANYLC